MRKLIIKDVTDFNLDHIFDCGQCFRWNREDDGSYTGVVFGYPANIAFEEAKSFCGSIVITSPFIAESMWRNYLDLDRDYTKIKQSLATSDEVISNAITNAQGVRILRQDKWETLISFIVSQNNNISRIKGCIESLCKNFGRPLGEFRGEERFDFPSIDELAAVKPSDLDVCRLGYRARYLAQTARIVKRDGGAKLSVGGALSFEEAREYLLTLPGVGPKVADCILLFSMEKTEAFPVDVWVARVMNELYGFDEEDHDGMQKFAAEKFSPFGGIAQQYLFYYIRESKKTLEGQPKKEK